MLIVEYAGMWHPKINILFFVCICVVYPICKLSLAEDLLRLSEICGGKKTNVAESERFLICSRVYLFVTEILARSLFLMTCESLNVVFCRSNDFFAYFFRDRSIDYF